MKRAPRAKARAPQPAADVPATVEESSEAGAERGEGDVEDLARRVRHAAALTPAMRRHWLTVLPYLLEEDRRRLAEILDGA